MNTETVRTRRIQFDNNSGTFSTKAHYTPSDDGNVHIDEWCFDSYGILPSGWTHKTLPITEAQSEYRERIKSGWLAI